MNLLQSGNSDNYKQEPLLHWGRLQASLCAKTRYVKQTNAHLVSQYIFVKVQNVQFSIKQIIFTDYMKCKHQPHSKWKPLCFTQENRYPFVKHGHFMINFAVSWLRLCQCLNVLEILSKWYKPICIGGLNHS